MVKKNSDNNCNNLQRAEKQDCEINCLLITKKELLSRLVMRLKKIMKLVKNVDLTPNSHNCY